MSPTPLSPATTLNGFLPMVDVVANERGNVCSNDRVESVEARKPLRANLFENATIEELRRQYKESQPYHHLVIPNLMDDTVLRGAREELKTNMQATLKETDIYKVYQTGDLANMDGLPEETKRLLPSLFSIRDGLYSLEFRKLVQSLTGSGPLSGEQIDLSVNAFGHTGHLLCHDDVIGTRKVSYILYLVDEDWGTGKKPDGGALQLYPLEREDVPGIPAFAPCKTIPPRWNQMVLFAVQPGKSFHDVQEVYNEHKPRLAVSGWFHGAHPAEMKDWPEHASNVEGEAAAGGGNGAEAVSTLQQLEGRAVAAMGENKDDGSPGSFRDDFIGGEDLEDLAEWVNPEYLAPSMVDQCAEAFGNNGSTIHLYRFLKEDVAKRIVDAVIAADKKDGLGYMEASPFDVGLRGGWRKAGPPHRQRLLRLSVDGPGEAAEDDEVGKLLRELRDKLFRSRAFKSLLQKLVVAPIVAGRRQARRFRPGLDYTLATPGDPWDFAREASSTNEQPGTKVPGSLGASEVPGGVDEGNDKEDAREEKYMVLDAVLCFVDDREPYKEAAWRQDEVGGYVTYLGGDDDDGGGDDEVDGEDEEDDGDEGDEPSAGDKGGGGRSDGRRPSGSHGKERGGSDGSAAGARSTGSEVGRARERGCKENGSGGEGEAKGQEHDAAIYRTDEGGLLVSVSAASNSLSLVLRDDTAVMSFVKYVSSAAPGSRFDITGEYLVDVSADDDDEEEEEDEDEGCGEERSGDLRHLGTVPEETSEGGIEDEGNGTSAEDERCRKRLKPG